MRWLRSQASSEASDSYASHLRRKRFTLFVDMVGRCDKQPVSILDVGGTERFWEIMNFADTSHRIDILNLAAFNPKHAHITSIVGDARDLSRFGTGEYDIVFSNSVIEHLSTLEDQKKMAEEVRRVGQRYFVQTPNYFFPMEPHFLTPTIHWLPQRHRITLLRMFPLGHYNRLPMEKARKVIEEIRLLKKSEIRTLFPDASIISEKWMGMTKSFIAVHTS